MATITIPTTNNVAFATSGRVFHPGYWDPSKMRISQWIDASDATTITEVGGKVSNIADKSGNSRDYYQGDPSSQPTYDGSKILFGGGSFLRMPDIAWAPLNSWESSFTFFIFVSYGATPSGSIFDYGATQSGYKQESLKVSGSKILMDYHHSEGSSVDVTSSDDVGSGMVVSYSLKPVGALYNRIVRFNGKEEQNRTSDDRSNTGINEYTLGADPDGGGFGVYGGFANDVNFHELIVVPGSIPLVEKERVEAYLAWKWSGGI